MYHNSHMFASIHLTDMVIRHTVISLSTQMSTLSHLFIHPFFQLHNYLSDLDKTLTEHGIIGNTMRTEFF